MLGDFSDEHLDLPVRWKAYGSDMQIDVLHVPHCPNLQLTRARLDDALQRSGLEAVVREVEVATPEDAVRLGMHGSPTILVEGVDLFEGSEASVACRLYRSDDRAEGAPAVDALLEALTR